MLRAGKLRHNILIQQRSASTARDAAGQTQDVWVTFHTCHCSIDPLQGRELIAAQAVNSVVTHQLRMRYKSGVTTAMRIKYGTRYFNIVSPPMVVEERNREMVLMCEEGLYNG